MNVGFQLGARFLEWTSNFVVSDVQQSDERNGCDAYHQHINCIADNKIGFLCSETTDSIESEHESSD